MQACRHLQLRAPTVLHLQQPLLGRQGIWSAGIKEAAHLPNTRLQDSADSAGSARVPRRPAATPCQVLQLHPAGVRNVNVRAATVVLAWCAAGRPIRGRVMQQHRWPAACAADARNAGVSVGA